MKPEYQIPVCITCLDILCTCPHENDLKGIRRFISVRDWAKANGISMYDLEEAEETLAKIKAQLIKLDPEYAKEFTE
jgi:hypothetical protein